MAGERNLASKSGQKYEDDEWEDVPDTNLARARSPSSTSSVLGTPRTATRRRKGLAKSSHFSTASRESTPLRRLPPQPRPQRQQQVVKINADDVQHALLEWFVATFRYAADVLSSAFHLLRKPLAFLVFLWILGVLLIRLAGTFRVVMTPFCILPGVSRTALCRIPDPREAARPQWADYPKLVESQSTNYERLLEGAAGGSALSLDIKKTEMATKDLVAAVRVSNLKSKDFLSQSLLEFVDDARKAGRGLQKLDSKINGAVEHIMAINDHALQAIEGAEQQNKGGNAVLRVLWPFPATPISTDVVVEAFQTSMDAHASEMGRLILAGEAALGTLDRLDERLAAVHELFLQEGISLDGDKGRVLAELWTRLGGNRRKLRRFEENYRLLRALGEYRQRASVHIAGAMQTVQAMSEDMEDLRERVAAPEIAGDKIPIGVHIKSIQSGMERLKAGRLRAKDREDRLMEQVFGLGD